ncbi:solute carrier family 35 member G1 [Dermacentor silvarum]|uniref:solute carrier family 35 member G1 n=1 Tax=Dermacentor silvarum TaxID=543639 RepID=UPI00189B3F38|nr:solute carrier family 35 member G1 [Dermacentor silvarum]
MGDVVPQVAQPKAGRGALGPPIGLSSSSLALVRLPSADQKATEGGGFPAEAAAQKKACPSTAAQDQLHETNEGDREQGNGYHTWQLYRGLAYSSLSSFFFSTCTVIVKMLNYIPAAELAVVRFLGILMFTAPLVMISRAHPLGPEGVRLLLILRGLLGATSLFLRFYAIHHMPIADASVIIFSVPVFVSALARIFLKEPCGLFHLVAVLVTLVGLALITKLPLLFGGVAEAESLQTRGVVAALSSTVFGASVYIVVRRLRDIHHSVIMFNFAWVAILETGAIGLLTTPLVLPRTAFDGGLLFALGAFSFGGQLLLTRALQLEHAGPVSMVRSATDIIFVFAWQVAFFGEAPDCYTVSGAVLVGTCVLFTGLRKWILSLPENSAMRTRMAWLLS